MIPYPEIVNPLKNQAVGGLVRIDVAEANDADDIVYSKFSYYDGIKWNEIGTDDGLVTDVDIYRGEWFTWWDTTDIVSGIYKVRIEMRDADCYIGYDEIEINVEKPPVALVEILGYDPETRTTIFDASDSYDPDGTIDEYIWTFYTYPEVTPCEGESVAFVSPENYDNYTLSLQLMDNLGVSTTGLYFNVVRTALEKKFAIEVQEIDNLKANLTAILNEKQTILNGMNPSDPGYYELNNSINAIKQALKWLSNAKLWLSRAKYWQQEGSQEDENRCIDNAKERIEWILDYLKNAIIEMERASKKIPNLENNINKLKEKYIRTVCLDAKVWIIREIGPTTHGAYVPAPDDIWICNGGSWYRSSNQSIHIDKNDVFALDVIYHEYDHHFMFKKNHKINLPGGAHDFCEKNSKELAWSEGWAYFSSCAKQNDPIISQPNWGKDDSNVETGRSAGSDGIWGNSDDYDCPRADVKGEESEASVVCILWDLFDNTPNEVNSTGDKIDEVSLSFKTIVAAMNVPEGSTDQGDIHDFYNRLKTVLTNEGKWNADMEQKIRTIFQNHGVTP